MSEQHELSRISAARASARTMLENDDGEHPTTSSRVHRRTLLKLDTLLLPFLALLFLFNSLDKSNVSSAQSPSGLNHTDSKHRLAMQSLRTSRPTLGSRRATSTPL